MSVVGERAPDGQATSPPPTAPGTAAVGIGGVVVAPVFAPEAFSVKKRRVSVGLAATAATDDASWPAAPQHQGPDAAPLTRQLSMPVSPVRAQEPPLPPCKSATPVSRIFGRSCDFISPSARPVLDLSTSSAASDGGAAHDAGSAQAGACAAVANVLSPLYDPSRSESYLEQCFEVLAKLGAGAFGEVFRVRSRDDGRLYAVKRSRFRTRGLADRERKLQEVHNVQRLGVHPNCVRYYLAWEERGLLHIQTELCELGSLKDYVEARDDALPADEIWLFASDILDGLKHVHDHGLLHMDIKPANIFICGDRTLKIGDFGIAYDTANGGSRFREEGDPKYLAPEVLHSEIFDRPADLFSLGIMLFELASFVELPSHGPLWHRLREGHLPEEHIRTVPPDLRAFIAHMMAPDPCDRPTIDEARRHPRILEAARLRSRKRIFDRIVRGATAAAAAACDQPGRCLTPAARSLRP